MQWSKHGMAMATSGFRWQQVVGRGQTGNEKGLFLLDFTCRTGITTVKLSLYYPGNTTSVMGRCLLRQRPINGKLIRIMGEKETNLNLAKVPVDTKKNREVPLGGNKHIF